MILYVIFFIFSKTKSDTDKHEQLFYYLKIIWKYQLITEVEICNVMIVSN